MNVICFSDSPNETGFGRIANEVGKRFVAKGHQWMGISILYGGQPHALPFWCWRLNPADIWNEATGIINQYKPDVVIVCQDFPYAQTLLNGCRVDWSKVALFVITPIDGTPVNPEWLDVVDDAAGTMVISRFGVEAMRQAGRRVGLCHPGIDIGHFKPATADEKLALRKKVGLDGSHFIVGMMAMNQGRKNVPATVEAFSDFSRDKPNARLYLDMDSVSPAGFNVPQLLKECGVAPERVLYRADWLKNEPISLRDRYCMLDAHAVISFREGFGLPLLESQACKIPTIALDWCSGTEIVGNDRGILIPTSTVKGRYGTWGGAQDKDPDMIALTNAFNRVYHDEDYAGYIARQGYEWAIRQTWDVAAQAVETEVEAALKAHKTKWGDTHEPARADHLASDSGVQPTATSAEVPKAANGEPTAVPV